MIAFNRISRGKGKFVASELASTMVSSIFTMPKRLALRIDVVCAVRLIAGR